MKRAIGVRNGSEAERDLVHTYPDRKRTGVWSVKR